MLITVAVDVDRPPGSVFDLMADARNEPSWNSQVSRSELDSGEPVQQGSRFTTTNRGQAYRAVITTYDRPGRLDYEVTGTAMTITAQLTFTGDGGRTHVAAVFDMQPRGVMKVVFPLMGPAVRRDFPKQFASFKRFCESQPA